MNHGIRELFPEVRRNAGTQAQSGGVDLENTYPFAFECKGGKKYKSAMLRKIIDQAVSEKGKNKMAVGLVKPLREDAYAVMPFEDFLSLLKR